MEKRNTLESSGFKLKPLVLACAVGAAFSTGDASAQVRAALVKEVDQSARQAVTIRRNTSDTIFETVYTVPAGKKLVVEQLNCSALGTASVYVGLFAGALAHANIVYSVPLTGSGAGVRILDGQTRLYFDPGAAINLRIFTSDSTTCTISGFTVDVLP